MKPILIIIGILLIVSASFLILPKYLKNNEVTEEVTDEQTYINSITGETLDIIVELADYEFYPNRFKINLESVSNEIVLKGISGYHNFSSNDFYIESPIIGPGEEHVLVLPTPINVKKGDILEFRSTVNDDSEKGMIGYIEII
ncbi:MAG: hypothetical protein Q9M91_03250 [Candidatus Dojkabacteria bacterium]|nr:hypothetical protein [Candidatus Dojkabacteria bacterium]MDQ7020840.1 hypothetical protein [Candidatus Dojkabacteria bacterium]